MAEMPNLVSADLTDEALSKFLALIDEAEALLPFLIALTGDERKRMPKLGRSGLSFVNQAHELVKQRREFMPGSFNVDEMSRDVNLLNKLVACRNRISSFAQKVRDTSLTVGSEAYKASLMVYRNGKDNGPADIQPVMEEMGALFARAKKETEEDGGEEG